MVYCSVECRKKTYREAARKAVVIDSCVACKRDYPRRYKNSTTCSIECWNAAYVRAEPLPDRTCALGECGAVFTPNRAGTKCCSERHGQIHWNRTSRADGRQQGSPWDERRKANHHKRRALKLQLPADDIRPAGVYERDEWMCGLCSGPVDPDAAYPDPLSPSLDHILPLSKGGHHILANVQLAHLACNVRKGAKTETDTMLV